MGACVVDAMSLRGDVRAGSPHLSGAFAACLPRLPGRARTPRGRAARDPAAADGRTGRGPHWSEGGGILAPNRAGRRRGPRHGRAAAAPDLLPPITAPIRRARCFFWRALPALRAPGAGAAPPRRRGPATAGHPRPALRGGGRGRGPKPSEQGRCRPCEHHRPARASSPSQREHLRPTTGHPAKTTAQHAGRAAREQPHRKGGTTPRPRGDHQPRSAKAPKGVGGRRSRGAGPAMAGPLRPLPLARPPDGLAASTVFSLPPQSHLVFREAPRNASLHPSSPARTPSLPPFRTFGHIGSSMLWFPRASGASAAL